MNDPKTIDCISPESILANNLIPSVAEFIKIVNSGRININDNAPFQP
jgi:hypothetical protein